MSHRFFFAKGAPSSWRPRGARARWVNIVYITTVSSVNGKMEHMRYSGFGPMSLLAGAAALLLAACSSNAPSDTASDPPLPLHALADITIVPANPALKGQTPRMDYETIDSRNRLLFVAYL